MKKNVNKLFMLVLIIFLMIPGTSVFAGSASGLNPLSYIVQEGWKYLDTDVSVTSSSNNWTDGYVDIDITSGKDAGDQLRIMSSGSLSVVGDAVSWGGTRIGTIDPTYNGSNGRLRINFSASLLNSGFETGNFSGWTVNTSYVSADGRTHTQTATVQSAVKYEGSYAAKLEIYGVTTGYGVGHGPQITSSNFYAKAGDTLSVRWYAEKTQDYYDVYGYLVNSSTGVRQQLFSQRGDGTTGWTAQNSTISTSVCASGQTCPLQFQFLCGSYDATGGTVIGSIMYIDGISVVTSVATDAAVDYIVEHLEYRNTSDSPTMNKSYTWTLKDSSHTGNASSTITLAKANTSTSITAISPEPSVFGQNYSVNVSVSAQSPSSGTPVGSVIIGDGTNSCTATLSGGSGSCSLPSNSIGVKSISAAYQGSTGYNSSSTSSSHTINKVGTTTTITSDLPDPSVYGQNYTVAVSVAAVAPGSGTPGGTVTVSDGTNNCSISLSGGSGSCTLPSSSAGGKTLTASYLESDYFLGSSDTESHTVNKTTTSTNVTRSVSTPVYGEPLSFSSTVSPVSPGTITPVGDVQFYIDGATFGNKVSLTSGSANSQSTINLNVSSHTYQAKYEGNQNNHSSDSSVVTFSITKNSTTTVVTTSSWPTSVYGQPAQIIATVAPVSPSVVTPVGQVQFYFEGSPIGSPVTLVNGVAQSANLHTLVPSSYLLANHIKVGSYGFSATYLGNSNSEGNVSTVGTQTILPAATELIISSNQNPSLYGTALDLTIEVTQQNESLVTPTGTVKLYIDGVEFKPTLTLNSTGQVTRTIPYYNLWPGEHAITAFYTPSSPAQFLVSDNAEGNEPLIQIVNKADASFVISSDVANPFASEPVIFSVQLTHPTQASVIPTGTIQFYDGAVAISGEIALDEDGKAVMTEPVRFSAGEHAITVRYSGDEYFKTVLNSTPQVLQVTKADTSTVILSAIPLEAVVGQPVSVSVKVSVAEPGVETPAGSVEVSNGVDECTVTLDGLGGGSCQLVSTSPGNKTLTATYQESSNHKSSVSSEFTGLIVDKASSNVQITDFSPIEPVTGQPITIYFEVDPVLPGNGLPSGDVIIYDDQGNDCSGQLDASGLGYCEIELDYAGNVTLTAEYQGDQNFYGDETTDISALIISKATTSLELATSTSPSKYGQNVRFTATVSVVEPGKGISTGFVQFKIDGSDFGVSVELTNGIATSEWIETLTVGSHNIEAQYLGSNDFDASEVDEITQEVIKADTSINLTSDQNPSQYGVPVLVTATVEGVNPSLLDPSSGTVQFIVDGVPYGASVPLDADGKASKLLPYTALWVGTHPVTAVYSGNDSFNGSNNYASPLNQVVEKGVGINLEFSFVETSPVFGQSFTIKGIIESENINNPHPVPTGSIQFYVDENSLGSAVTIDEALSATSSVVSGLSIGSHSIKLVYSGDDYYSSRTLETTVSVQKSATSVVVNQFNPQSVVVGQSTLVNFTVTAELPGAGVPSGSVTVSFGSDTCIGDLINGIGSCELTPEHSATGILSISYAGDSSFFSSNASSAQNLIVNKADVILTVIDNFSEQTFVVGEKYEVIVNVEPDSPGTLIPVGGIITISNDDNQCDAIIQSDGNAACEISQTTIGQQNLLAVFTGNDDFNSALSTAVTGPMINQAETTTEIITIDPSPSVFGQNYIVHISVTSETTGTPSGTVTVTDGTNSCSPAIVLENGLGSCVLPSTSISAPSKTIMAEYAGDTNYKSSSTSTNHVINKAGTTTTITLVTPEPTAFGESYIIAVTVTSNTSGVPTGTVSIGAGTNNCEDITLVDGKGSCSLLSTVVDSVTITGVYNGDDNFLSSSDTEEHTIVKANTTTTITSITPEPSVYGQNYSVAVSVAAVAPGNGTPSGTVAVSDGAGNTCDITLTSGSGSCNLPSNVIGENTISVSYSGDTYFNTSSDTESHTVNKADSATIATITPEPSVYGQNYSVAVSVTAVAPGNGTPSGTVEVSDGEGNTCDITLTSGSGSCNLPSNVIGENTISVSYSGDTYFNNSSDTESHTVNKADSATIATITPEPSVYGQNYSVAVSVAAVAPGNGTPSGTVAVSDGAGNSCDITLTSGSGSCNLPSNVIGENTISVSYSGDTYFNTSSDTESHTVNKADTTTIVTSITSEPSVYGQNYSVAVNVASVTTGTPSGSITVSDGANLCTELTLDADGSANCSLPSLGAEIVEIIVTYSGNDYFNGSDASVNHTIIKANTSTNASLPINDPVYGQPIYFNALVEVVSPGSFIPKGEVQFYLDGVLFGDEVLVDEDGKASSETINDLEVDSHTIYVEYQGDLNNNGSNSLDENLMPITFNIQQNTTTTTLSSSSPSSVYGQPIQLVATVTQEDLSELTPVGQVQFYFHDGEEFIPLGTPATVVDGKAELSDLHTILSGHVLVGEYEFYAQYLGNQNSKSSQSETFTQKVLQAATVVEVTTSDNTSIYGTSLEMTIKVTQEKDSLVIPTGSVQLWIDGVKFMSPLVLDSNGKAVRTVPYLNLWPGEHRITADFTPSVPAQFESSDNLEAPLNHTVIKASPEFEITASIDTPVASELVGFEVVVTHPFKPEVIPTGTVQFFVDGEALGNVVVLNDQGRAQSSESIRLNAGSYDITVSYSGDEYFFAEVSPIEKETIKKADTTVEILSVDPLSVVVGEETSVSVKVFTLDPAIMIAYGKVVVSLGLETCDAILDESGAGSCDIATNAAGEIEITAQFTGSEDHNESQIATYSSLLTVSPADSAVSITEFSPQNPVTGQSVTIQFSVIPVAPGWGQPTGLVTISDGDGRSCQAELNELGSGECLIVFDHTGAITLNAAYAGDGNFNPASLEGFSGLEIAKADTSLGLTTSVSPAKYGQVVTFTASISVDDPGAGQPTGKVQFYINDAAFGEPINMIDGKASSGSINSLVVGEHIISATYLGDDNFNSTNAVEITQQVDKADSVLVLTSDQNPSPYGVSVLVTAQILGVDPSERIPTSGFVQFIVDGVPYGAPVPLNSEGQANKLLPYTALWVGTHPITAIYSGNDWFNGSDNLSDPWMQVVEKGDLTILVDFSVENPVVGESFTISGEVVGNDINNPTPEGTLEFFVDDTLLGVIKTLDHTASATSDLAGGFEYGAKSVKLVYSGDDYYKAHTVETSIMVEKADTSVEITGLSSNSVIVGEKVTVNFSVDVLSPGIGEATGLVTVSNGVDECSGNLTDGSGSCDLLPGFSDEMLLTAQYAGDGNFNTSATTQPYTGLSVEKASLSLEITDLPTGPFVIGQPYTISVLVSPVDPGTLLPVGAEVTISNGVDSCEAIVQVDGSAACEITPSTLDALDFIASFAGDDNFNAVQSTPVAGPQIDKADTQVSVTTSINPGVESTAIIFTANVNVVAPGAGNPDGFVQFQINGEDIGSIVAVQNGKATSSEISDLLEGIHAVKAIYLGSELFNGTDSSELSQKIVAGNLSETVKPGQGTTITYHGMQNGQPVTTIVQIPADAVGEEVTVVYHQFNETSLEKPEGMDFVTHFTLKVYKNGELQPGFEFLVPVQISMEYNPKDWDVESFEVMGWTEPNVIGWQNDGIEIIENDYETNSIVFTLQNTSPEEFSLLGVHEYVYYFPVINR
ncbi:MAG: Ig-like domain-containing protein [Anaerolineaceae bacterium]|nr:Ig-like domain-containing protein [Anaerolineaceae bacterium]